ncbi:MAG: hypothetical protein H0U27_08960 [Nitrosopumilus sp.]|nr:hypothetical protein [Nitrosopumilus sp.]
MLSLQLSAQTLSLSPSNYNGYNISCFGGTNGSINLTVTGGTAPYTYSWSNNATTEDISNLRSGYYKVIVDDADTLTRPVSAEITLTEPSDINVSSTAFLYPNTYNISLYGACNGSIDVTVSSGVSPYTYLWADASTTQDRSSLCANSYKATITDANGCIKSTGNIILTQPDRSDWQVVGNASINASTNFLGTTDNNDVVFKSNNIERARLKSNGDFIINRIITNRIVSPDTIINFGDSTIQFATNYNRLWGDPTGTTNKGTAIGLKAFCGGLYSSSIGYNTSSSGQYSVAMGFRVQASDNYSIVIGNGTSSTNLTNSTANTIMMGCNSDIPTLFLSSASGSGTTGAVGIGTTSIPSGYKLVVDGGKVGFREVFVKLSGQWPDYVFSDNYDLLSLDRLKKYVKTNNSLPGMIKSNLIENEGQNIGEIQRLQQEKIEELYLYILQLNDKIKDLESKIIEK